MNTRTTRIMITASLSLLLIIPAGCRSKKTVEPQLPPIITETPVSVPEPTDFVVERSNEETIDWNDLDELNRIAASRGWLRDAFYAYDSSDLNEEARTSLSDSAKWLRENPAYTLTVEGHCDERGTEQYNLALGERRSHVARQYMQSLGVDGNRFQTISYGESRPFAEGSSEQAYSQNRRAHLRISGKVN